MTRVFVLVGLLTGVALHVSPLSWYKAAVDLRMLRVQSGGELVLRRSQELSCNLDLAQWESANG